MERPARRRGWRIGIDLGGTWIRAIGRDRLGRRRQLREASPGLAQLPAWVRRLRKRWAIERGGIDVLVVASRGVWTPAERRHQERRLSALAPKLPDDIRRAPGTTAAFSEAMASDIGRLKAFLLKRVYRHEHVMRIMRDAEGIVRDLFSRYLAEPSAMPAAWHAASRALSERRLARLIADFVAGMTDRYALGEHRRLFDATPNLR